MGYGKGEEAVQAVDDAEEVDGEDLLEVGAVAPGSLCGGAGVEGEEGDLAC